MILDLIVILLVVILSYLFCMNNDKYKHNCFLSHIVVGLTVIVFYKLARHFKLKQKLNSDRTMNPMNPMNPMNTMNTMNPINTEKFTVDASLSAFIANNTDEIAAANPGNLDAKTLADYTSTIQDLTNELQILNNNNPPEEPTSQLLQSGKSVDSISLENQQAYQQFQINFLANQIKNAQNVINADTISKSSQNYKPIKVYSSCVANADGSLTTEQQVKSEFQSTPTKAVSSSDSAQQILSSISQNSPNIQTKLQTLLNNLGK
jgi:hypothetical protein